MDIQDGSVVVWWSLRCLIMSLGGVAGWSFLLVIGDEGLVVIKPGCLVVGAGYVLLSRLGRGNEYISDQFVQVSVYRGG